MQFCTASSLPGWLLEEKPRQMRKEDGGPGDLEHTPSSSVTCLVRKGNASCLGLARRPCAINDSVAVGRVG